MKGHVADTQVCMYIYQCFNILNNYKRSKVCCNNIFFTTEMYV